RDWKQAIAADAGVNDGALLDLLSEAEPKPRWVAAKALARSGAPWQGDAAAAQRVLARVAEEKHPAVAYALGGLVGRIRMQETKLEEPVLAELALTSPREQVRLGALESILVVNGDNEK